MKLLTIDYLRISPMVELLAPSSGDSPLGQWTHDNGNLLHRTPGGEEEPDVRYWTHYDHFMSEYEARVQRAAYFSGLVAIGWRKLVDALSKIARRVTAHPQTAN